MNAMRDQAYVNLRDIVGELIDQGRPLLDEDRTIALDLACSAIELRVFPLVAFATALETNAIFSQQVIDLYDVIVDEAEGYLPKPHHQIPGQMVIGDADPDREPF